METLNSKNRCVNSCRIIFCIVLVLLMACTSCNKKSKSPLEQKVESGVKNSLGDPNDLIELVTINLSDSTDCTQISKKLPIDSIKLAIQVASDSFTKKASTVSPSALNSFSEEERQKIRSKFLVVMNRMLSLKTEIKEAKECEANLLKLEEEVDSSTLILKSYIVKARIYEKGDKVVKTYYASTCLGLDSIIVADSKIKSEDMPLVSREILKAYGKYTDKVSSLMSLVDEIEELNRIWDRLK